ncbi:hypothetical protein ABI59_08865 [Acidobacteria bacterium Mor1]|nr:hypothetical protein ABI59_08865 [Acidobacteria bacterium Mor1]
MNDNPMERLTEQTLERIRSLNGNLDIRVERGESSTTIDLPPGLRADFRVRILVHGDGEPYLEAIPTQGDPEAAFWSWEFEETDFDSTAERDRAFLEALRLMLTAPCRIQMKVGFVLVLFWCEIRERGDWYQIDDGIGYLKWTLRRRPPEITGKLAQFVSPALAVR